MRQNRIAYLADFGVYPVLTAVMILVVVDNAGSGERALALMFALAGSLLWALMEYFLHRSVRQQDPRLADLENRDQGGTRAWIGTAIWLSVAAVVLIALLPTRLAVALIVALILVGGLIAGFILVRASADALRRFSNTTAPQAMVMSGQPGLGGPAYLQHGRAMEATQCSRRHDRRTFSPNK